MQTHRSSTAGALAFAAALLCSFTAEAQNTAPFPNRANEVMPSWLRVRGEFRERVEGFTNAGFVEGRDDAYSLSRLRLNATVTPARWLSFQAQAQDARVARKQVGPTGLPFRGLSI